MTANKQFINQSPWDGRELLDELHAWIGDRGEIEFLDFAVEGPLIPVKTTQPEPSKLSSNSMRKC